MLPVCRSVTIVNDSGLCSRPAAEFVCAAKRFRSKIWLVKGGERISATKLIDVLNAGLGREETAKLEAEGPDAETAVEQLAELILVFARRDRERAPSSFWRYEDDF